jgi:hypothetical protein
MTVVILALLLAWIGIGALFRAIGLAVRLIVMLALASAILRAGRIWRDAPVSPLRSRRSDSHHAEMI